MGQFGHNAPNDIRGALAFTSAGDQAYTDKSGKKGNGFVRKCAFRDLWNYGISAYDSDNLIADENVIFGAIQNGNNLIILPIPERHSKCWC